MIIPSLVGSLYLFYNLQEQFGLLCSSLEVRASPRVHRFQVTGVKNLNLIEC